MHEPFVLYYDENCNNINIEGKRPQDESLLKFAIQIAYDDI